MILMFVVKSRKQLLRVKKTSLFFPVTQGMITVYQAVWGESFLAPGPLSHIHVVSVMGGRLGVGVKLFFCRFGVPNLSASKGEFSHGLCEKAGYLFVQKNGTFFKCLDC